MPDDVTPSVPAPRPMAQPVADTIHQQRAQNYNGYYNSRFYGYQYGIHNTANEAPHQFSRTADTESKQRPLYIGVAAVALLFGIFMIFSAFNQPIIDPALQSIIQGSPSREVRAVVFCNRCQSQLESSGLTVIAYYEDEGAYLVLGKGTDLIPLGSQSWVTRVGSPA